MPNTIRRRLAAAAALVILSMLALAACGTTTTTTNTTNTSTPATNTPAGQTASPAANPENQQTQVGAIGQTMTVNGKWQITVVNFRLFTPPNQTPAAGNQFVAAEVNVKNIATTAAKLTDTGHFVLSNAAGTHFNTVYVGGISLDLSQAITPGAQEHAVVAFEAPSTTTQFILTFTGPGAQSNVDYVRWNLSL